MSRGARLTLPVVLVALVLVVCAIVWVTMRQEQAAAAAPIPGRDQARVVVADPSIELPYLVEVPGTADGCPAASFRSPAEPNVVSDGFASLMLPRSDAAAVLVTCMGEVDERGTPEEFVEGFWSGEAFDDDADAAAWERLSIERVASPFGDALALTSRIGGRLLTDHYVERDGWVYAVGYLRDESEGEADRAVVDAILASWEWR